MRDFHQAASIKRAIWSGRTYLGRWVDSAVYQNTLTGALMVFEMKKGQNGYWIRSEHTMRVVRDPVEQFTVLTELERP